MVKNAVCRPATLLNFRTKHGWSHIQSADIAPLWKLGQDTFWGDRALKAHSCLSKCWRALRFHCWFLLCLTLLIRSSHVFKYHLNTDSEICIFSFICLPLFLIHVSIVYSSYPPQQVTSLSKLTGQKTNKQNSLNSPTSPKPGLSLFNEWPYLSHIYLAPNSRCHL